MASERAKENKTLIARCSACGKNVSTELVRGVLVERGARRATMPVCDECRHGGWEPPAENDG